jgi:hypothetical protein
MAPQLNPKRSDDVVANAQQKSLTSLPNKQQRIVVSLLVFVSFASFVSFSILLVCNFPLGLQHFRFFNSFPCHATLDDVSIASSMPVPTSNLATAFAVDGPRGTDFFDSIDPPGKVDTLHAILLDGSKKTPAMGEIAQSFGHRVSRSTQLELKVPDVHLSGQDRIDYGTIGFDRLNNPQVLGTARLQSLQDHPVGAVLLVSSGGGGTPYITVVANPSITPVDSNSPDGSGGAPLWEEAFESSVMPLYGAAASTWQCMECSVREVGKQGQPQFPIGRG